MTTIRALISCSPTDPEFDADGDIASGKINLISYGLELRMPPHLSKFDRQLDSLQNIYGFDYENRGCVVDSVSLIKMKEYNAKVITHLAKLNGVNWYEKYQRQADSLYNSIVTNQDTLK